MLITSPSCAVSGTAGTSGCLTSACCALVNAAAAISTAVYVVGYAHLFRTCKRIGDTAQLAWVQSGSLSVSAEAIALSSAPVSIVGPGALTSTVTLLLETIVATEPLV